jgi:hypothetical protein
LRAPEAAGLDAVLRGLSMMLDDPAVLATTGPLFNGLYGYYRRATLLGRPPPEAPSEQEQKCRSILTIPHPPRPPGTSPSPARSR